jgi:UDP-glucose 4-epimerase
VVAIFLSLLLHGKSPVINGDGKQTRDYVYVDDVVAANIAALNADFVGEVNIGTGLETNVLEIFGQLREAVTSTTEAQHGPAKPGEQRRSCIDARRAAEVLNWRAKIPLSEGLRRTAHWYRNSLSQ